jgi:hypothetical protein
MATSSSADPDGKGSSAKRLFSEICGGYSDEKLIAYWEGRLTDEATRRIYDEVLCDPTLRARLTEIAERLFRVTPEDNWDSCFNPDAPKLVSRPKPVTKQHCRHQPPSRDSFDLLANDSQKSPWRL